MLKSALDTSALKIIEKLIGICSKGGFTLTKFITNNADIWVKFSEEGLKTGTLNCHLNVSSLLDNQAPWMQWCLKDYAFNDIKLREANQATSGSILSAFNKVYDPFSFAAPFCHMEKRILQSFMVQEFRLGQSVTRWCSDGREQGISNS